MGVSAACPNGVAKVQTKYNGVTWIATVLTGYIYSPMRVRVWCNPVDGSTPMDSHDADTHEDPRLLGLMRDAVEEGRASVEDGELVLTMH